MSDLILGAWRNGLSEGQAGDLEEIEKRHEQGFRLMPLDYLVLQFADYLNEYDELFAELVGDTEPVSEAA